MKKIFTTVLAIILMLSISPTTVQAAEYSEYVEADKNNFEGQTDIDYRVYSSYYVTIPTRISEYDSSGTVSVTMDNIEQGYHIEIYITNLDSEGCLTVSSDNGNTGKLNVLHDNGLYTVYEDGLVTKFYPGSYGYAGTASTDISFANAMSGNTKAGTYHGTVCFRIECVPDTN